MGRFDSLSDLDFEVFAGDLLRASSGLPYRAGMRGRDGGIDLLATVDGRRHVVQCKHFRESTYPQLKRAVKEERAKIEGREDEFASYKFVTSKALNHDQHAELVEILSPHAAHPGQVLGGNDVERLLAENPEVEARHVKLWLGGAGPLQALLSAAAEQRSLALLEQTRAALPRYVETHAFRAAHEVLGREGVCVIAGPPGVGKTTLARLLLLDGLEHGFQPYEIVPGAMADAWELLKRNEKQVFYFDDFLGSTALDESRYADADLLRFIAKVAGDKDRRFVLTTREYILRQARRMSEILDREASDAHRFLLTLESYSRNERARIFYNHIYHSEQVDSVARQSLLSDRAYLRIVDHQNYSPRLIEWITGWSAQRLGDPERSRYAEFCLESLDNPERLWKHAFEVGLGAAERALLLSMLGLPRYTDAHDAEASFESACDARGLPVDNRAFSRALQVLDDSFLSSTQSNERIYLSWINPSLLDYLRSYLRQSRADVEICLKGASYFEQALFQWRTLAREPALRDGLAGPFSATFERTLSAPPPRVEPGLFNRQTPSDHKQRLSQVLDCVTESKALAAASHTWLAQATDEWVKSIYSYPSMITGDDLRLAARLGERGLLDSYAVAVRLKEEIQALSPTPDRWNRLDDLAEWVQGLFTEAEWEAEKSSFEEFVELALEDAADYLADPAEIDTIQTVANGFGLVLDEEQLEAAREDLTGEDARDWDDYYDEREDDWGPDDGDADRDIDAIFGRLEGS